MVYENPVIQRYPQPTWSAVTGDGIWSVETYESVEVFFFFFFSYVAMAFGLDPSRPSSRPLRSLRRLMSQL